MARPDASGLGSAVEPSGAAVTWGAGRAAAPMDLDRSFRAPAPTIPSPSFLMRPYL